MFILSENLMSSNNVLQLVAALSSAAILSGCVFMHSEKTPPADAVAVQSWFAEGVMIFRCDYDEKGFYWVFEEPDAKLWNDAVKPKRLEARLGRGYTLRHLDGSVLRTQTIVNRGIPSANNLRDAVFETTSSETGVLQGVRWMERRRAEGGMPSTHCSPSQRGTRLRVPFTARWILYR